MQAGEGLGKGSVLCGTWTVNWGNPLPQPLARSFAPVLFPPVKAEKHFSRRQSELLALILLHFQPNLPAGTGCAAYPRPGQGGGGSGRNKALTILVSSSENLQEKIQEGLVREKGEQCS